MTGMEDGLTITAIGKGFGPVQVLKNVSLEVPRGEFHTLLGPSGSGKTTLLKIVAGFTPADSGAVTLAGHAITDMPPEHRNIGVVFQHYALFPHMSVIENIGFGLKMRGVAKAERAERVEEVLRLVRMTGFGHRRPAALSGGQQQRVALARALVIKPQLLLLDEPLSALDRKVRQEVREELKRIQAETGVTTVMVTHDQEEALFLADRVLVLESGSLRQQGSPTDIYANPADEFVAGFLGAINLLKVKAEGPHLRLGHQSFAPPSDVIHALAKATQGAPLHLAVRPEELLVEPGEAAVGQLAGRLTATEFGGPVVTLRVDVEGQEVSVLSLSPDVLAAGPWDSGHAGAVAHSCGKIAEWRERSRLTVNVSRQWNSWDARDPLAMVHLPTGLTLRFSVFSSADGQYRLLGQGSGITLLEHASDGSFIRAVVAHAGAELELTYTKPDPHQVCARLRVLKLGEWGLRFWMALEVGFQDLEGGPAPWRSDEPWISVENMEPMPPGSPSKLIARHRSLWASIQSSEPAVCGGAYAAIETFAQDLNTRGYYAPPRAETGSRWGALRFNAQMHPEVCVGIALGTDRAMAETASADLLRSPPERSLRGEEPARAAVRDIIAWNTLWDKDNHRVTTVLTRNWLTGKFSGWGVWLNDMLFHALLAGMVGDFATARANLEAALGYQSPEGNLACLRTTNEEWIDRSQSPIGAYVLWRLYEMTGDRSLLIEHFPVLLRAHRWWMTKRDGNGDGLIEYGSSATGTGAFVHTKQGAMDESFMDNASIFDRAGFDPEAHTLTMAEPGLNSLVSLDAQCLARIAEVLGKIETAAELRETTGALNACIADALWDAERKVFAGRHWSGVFEPSLSVTCFYPLLAGAASEFQTEALIELYLLSPEKFWGDRVLPSSAHDDPASEDNVYWRGRIWPPHLFLVWEGLRRAGREDLAGEIATRAWAMFEDSWRDGRVCRENFHRHDPAGDESPDADRFYSWGGAYSGHHHAEGVTKLPADCLTGEAAQKTLRPLILWIVDQLARRPNFDNPACIHEDDAIRDIGRKFQLMRHDDHRHAALRQIAHDLQDLAHKLGVERRGRLIEQQQLGLHGERAGDGDTLLLPAGELGRIGFGLFAEANAFQQRHALRSHLRARPLQDPCRPLDNIADCCQMREQMKALEDHACHAALLQDFALGEWVQRIANAAIAGQLTVKPKRAS